MNGNRTPLTGVLKTPIWFTILALLLFGCAGGGAGGGTEVGNPAPAFTADAELETYLKQQYASSLVPDWLTEADASAAAGSGDGSGAAVSDGQGGGSEANFSETNVQEMGVDESDKVKTDGNHIYVAGNTAVNVVQTDADGNLEALSRIEVGGAVDSLYLRGETLVVLYTPASGVGGYWGGIEPAVPALMVGMPYWLPIQAKTGVLLMDVEDPANPTLIKEWILDGRLISSRRIDAKLHVIQQFLPDLPPIAVHYDSAEGGVDQVIRDNLEQLESLTLDQLTPSYAVLDENGDPLSQGRLVATEDFVRPSDPEGATIVAVVTIDLDNPDADHQSMGAVLDAHHVYASTDTLYLASQRWRWSAAADAWFGGEVVTSIHGLDLTAERVSYVGKGRVPGSVLNQFSFGEYKRVLRVATTTGWSWDGTSGNNVYCLQAANGVLETIGKLEGLAPGETIYSARFIGTRGFLVTFVKVDPLLTLDLSDPTAPQVVGELKVPGYSDYIHPLGENHLLTIGKDTTLENDIAWYQGVQLSIFDITDFANPVVLHQEVLGDRGTHSEALHNHKAFTYWAERGLLAIPLELHEHEAPAQSPSAWAPWTFTGLQVLRVDIEQGFARIGRISTADAASPTCFSCGWTRGLFIEDDVFAVTADAVRAANVDDIPGTIQALDLKE
jgi:hypothetical protein